MPITYSFTTTLQLPTSSSWPCMDVGELSMPNILLFPAVSASRGTPWIYTDGNNDLVLLSNDGIPSVVTISLPIGQKFTFETDFIPSQLPQNLDDLANSHLFISVFNAQDDAGGVLLSKSGLAIVSSYGNTVMPVGGSQDILPESNDYYTLRMVVDGENNVMDLYITKTSDLASIGHQLRYTTAAPITPSGTPDSVRLEVLGNGTVQVEGKFSTLRCNCNGLNIPNKRPIAEAGRDQTAVIGSILRFDGSDSYDPEGATLTYKWTLALAPENSGFRLSGTNGFTQDDGDGDGWTDVFESTVDAWNVANAPGLQPGDLLVVGDGEYEVATTDWTYNSTTGEWERGGTFDPKKLRVTTESISDNLSSASWEVFHQSSFWDDRTSPQPTCVPDVHGVYVQRLVVNDGSLDSLPDEVLSNISESNVAMGVIPDVNFIWDYLSDAWGFYDDRGPVTTIWSGFAQVAANILLTAWQLDYAKSLVDIQRTFQRRWLDYRPLFSEPADDRDDAEIKIVRGTIYSDEIPGGGLVFGTSDTLLISRDDESQVTVTLSGTMTAQETVDAINEALGEKNATNKTASVVTVATKDYLALDYATLLVLDKDGTANAVLGFSTTEDTENIYGGSDGSIGSVATAFQVGAADLEVNFLTKGILREDLFVFTGVGYEVQKVADQTQLTSIQDMAAVGTRTDWQLSSYIKAANTNFTDELVGEGDILIMEVRELGAVTVREVLCEVTGARNQHVGFNPRPLFELVGADLDNYEISLIGVRRTSAIPVDELVQRIPRLQEVIVDPTTIYTENRDFIIEEDENEINGVRFSDGLFSFENPPPDILWAEVTFLDNRPMIEDNFGKAVDFTVEDLEARTDDLDYLSAVRGLWYAFFNGPSLWSVRIGTQILLGLPFAEVDGTIEDINLTFNANSIRILVRDKIDTAVIRTYFIPRSTYFEENGLSMVAVNPDTDTEYVIGDEVSQFYPLSKGVDILDWVKDPDWWRGYQGQGVFIEIEKYFRYMLQADIDVFNITNLVFAIDFAKKIDPHFTYPWWVVLKRVPAAEISVTDEFMMSGTLYLYDHPACAKQITDAGTGGAYRFDDTDESGNYNWAFDGAPHSGSPKPEFLYDRKFLCPSQQLLLLMRGVHGGSYFPFDWFWAFDDGGGTDNPALSGPDSSPPAPYGPLVGTVKFDTTYPAGTYTRGKVIT